ncbi:hypothetical protein HL653_12655 [Sphingomonas sp. AP4-R1]|uniref:hypothetical protein n=1 Tax=Sphingomonas sp. AP4-R1 TaxID=2735134 RepID=UPI001493AD23|nr:hypothetical protein [Sphingomonas sp. AP4-R1]QJU58499.1 hypothetical protein HL653_12655 [Sphingomonas sp. AP4-R1]
MSKSDKKPAKAEATAEKTMKPSALETARGKAVGAVQDTIALLEANPLAALLGGIALGAAAGALIPRGEKEKALLAPLGDKLAAAATAAIAAGREAGGDALKGGSLDKDALREQVSGLFGEATKAASAAGLAAFAAGKEKISG